MRKQRMLLISVMFFLLCFVLMLGVPQVGLAAGPPKTLKVGVIAWLGFPIGLDMVNGIEIMAELDNAKGGIQVGGEKYKVEFIVYDSANNQATVTAAANRLIYEDKVKFILSGPILMDAWLPIAEKNKVIAIGTPPTPGILSPKNKYSYLGGFMNCGPVVFTGWFVKKFPDVKTIAVAYPDSQEGHAYSEPTQKVFETFGMTVKNIFYPAQQQDLSALGTKVKVMNPDVFIALAGGPIGDGLAYKAVWQSGYKGKLYASTTQPLLTLTQVLPLEALEGFINGAWPVEFDPALTDQAKEFKAAYIAKHGKWNGPEITCTSTYACLRAALAKAGSLDVDKVAQVIGSGLEYEGPTGKAVMVSRPDQGNNRTVDSVVGYYIKEIVDGKPKLIGSIELDEAVRYFKQIYK